jgi:hypothetical protein
MRGADGLAGQDPSLQVLPHRRRHGRRRQQRQRALEVATGKIIAAHSKRRRRVEFLDFMNSVTAVDVPAAASKVGIQSNVIMTCSGAALGAIRPGQRTIAGMRMPPSSSSCS